jgi:hypothetical protein
MWVLPHPNDFGGCRSMKPVTLALFAGPRLCAMASRRRQLSAFNSKIVA